MPLRTAPQRLNDRCDRERKTVRIKVQYAPSDAARLKAAIAPKKLATHLHDLSLAALGRPVSSPARPGPTSQLAAEIAVATYQLRKIGNNLNQLAKQANAGMVAVTRPEMEQVLVEVAEALGHIKRLRDEVLG